MPIKEKKVTSIAELWNLLSPVGDELSSFKNPVFRGQGSADWKLLPAAHRHLNTQSEVLKGAVCKETIDAYKFLKACDRSGIPIPGDGNTFRNYMDECYKKAVEEESVYFWPSACVHPFLAFAQHHGLTTRFLDWSYSPFVALYFAVSQAIALDAVLRDDVALWVLDKSAVPSDNSYKEKIDFVGVLDFPGVVSKNFVAQKACLSVCYEGRDHSIMNLVDLYDVFILFNKLLKVVIDKKLLFDLSSFLNSLGYSAESLFPGVDGAIRSVNEVELMRKYRTKYGVQ